MKNYFETEKTIVPFNRVISICEIFNEDFRVEVEQINNFSEAIQPFFIFPIDQLANYLNWLDLQHKKDLELAGLNKPIIAIKDDCLSDHIEDKLGIGKPVLTREQVAMLIRKDKFRISCNNCKESFNENCQCSSDCTPTDEFVAKINKLLEEK